MRRFGARLGLPVALLSVFGGCWASTGRATLELACLPAGASVMVSGQAVGRCGDGLVGVSAGLQTVEVSAGGSLPLRLQLWFEPWEVYVLDGRLEAAVPGLDATTGSGGD